MSFPFLFLKFRSSLSEKNYFTLTSQGSERCLVRGVGVGGRHAVGAAARLALVAALGARVARAALGALAPALALCLFLVVVAALFRIRVRIVVVVVLLVPGFDKDHGLGDSGRQAPLQEGARVGLFLISRTVAVVAASSAAVAARAVVLARGLAPRDGRGPLRPADAAAAERAVVAHVRELGERRTVVLDEAAQVGSELERGLPSSRGGGRGRGGRSSSAGTSTIGAPVRQGHSQRLPVRKQRQPDPDASSSCGSRGSGSLPPAVAAASTGRKVVPGARAAAAEQDTRVGRIDRVAPRCRCPALLVRVQLQKPGSTTRRGVIAQHRLDLLH